VLILWDYSDPDGDTVTFDLFYKTEEFGWQAIVMDLINETSFEWNLRSFNMTSNNVTIRIEANDGYGGIVEDLTLDPITIRKYQPPLDSVPYIPLVILSVSIPSSGIIVTGLFVRKKRKKSKQVENEN
jgi:hypothetical protein